MPVPEHAAPVGPNGEPLTSLKDAILPDKNTGGPVAQLKKNLHVYAQVYAECMKHAEEIVGDSIKPDNDEPMSEAEFTDRQIEIANVMFGQFWNDQIAIKKNNPMDKAFELLRTYIEEKGQMGPGMGIGGYMGRGF